MALTSRAQMWEWADTRGNVITAEWVYCTGTTDSDNVCLRDRYGKERNIALLNLSERDRDYVRANYSVSGFDTPTHNSFSRTNENRLASIGSKTKKNYSIETLENNTQDQQGHRMFMPSAKSVNNKLSDARKSIGANSTYPEKLLKEIDRRALSSAQERMQWRMMTHEQKQEYIARRRALREAKRQEQAAKRPIWATTTFPGQSQMVSSDEMTQRSRQMMEISIQDVKDRQTRWNAENQAEKTHRDAIHAREQMEDARFRRDSLNTFPGDRRTETMDARRQADFDLQRLTIESQDADRLKRQAEQNLMENRSRDYW